MPSFCMSSLLPTLKKKIAYCILDRPVAMYFWCGLIGHVCISGHVYLQLSSSSNHLTSILQDNSSWQTDMRTHLLKSMASGPLKIEKGTRPVLILATHRHTTESVKLHLITENNIKKNYLLNGQSFFRL